MISTQTFQIGVGASTQRDYILAVKEAMQQARATIYNAKIDLTIVFTSSEFAHPNTLKTVKDIVGDSALIGCSTGGVIAGNEVLHFGIAIALICLPEKTHLVTADIDAVQARTALKAGEELGEKLVSGFSGLPRDFGLIFYDGLMAENWSFIAGLQEKLGISFPLIGAAASDNLQFAKTSVFHNERILQDAASGVLFGGRLISGYGIEHGWKPIGKPRTVTKSINNVVYEIDGVSATNVYEDYFACNLERLKKESRRISILYPIGISLPDEKEILLRNILSIENNGSLIFQGNVPEGSPIRLMIGTKESCLEATKKAAGSAQQRFLGTPCNLILVFDSMSRNALLGRDSKKEIKIIRDVFGPNVPLIGACTYGEQSPLESINYKGKTYLHNQTITILAIGG
ncbi:MAG TPA: FIST N-terminal domain-containing protein [Candidatus Omnitrophota bacterium]|nr:FIST N-terminal domain-containing protein [Candidatus Omnitrophota bacterium]HPT07097.1 FIST N-terminal domain-containing protein [Candidatus Omnitrophota bacterium]